MTPKDAYLRLWQVLEGVNAIIAELFASDVMQGKRDRLNSSSVNNNRDNDDDSAVFADWSDGLDDVDDSELYFSPDRCVCPGYFFRHVALSNYLYLQLTEIMSQTIFGLS